MEWLLVAPLLDKDFNRNSFELNDPLSWEGSLRSEPVKVRKTRVQHEMDEIDDGKYGAYAYWVGDEGVKTKVSVKNPNRNSTLSRIKKDNLMVATEPNIQFEFNGGLGVNAIESGYGISWNNSATEERKNDIFSMDTLIELSGSTSKLNAHYHSLTTDTFGVLSDVRTGGLKRDLSSAFANEENWADLESVNDVWSDDFSNYIYKHRVFYQKSVPLEKNSKENDWRLGSDQTLLEEHGILAGPRWTTMGSFHNLYLASNYGDITPDQFPRIVGDNNVLFNHLFPLDYDLIVRAIALHSGVALEFGKTSNFFRGLENRPEPRNHPVQPVLVEFKYSHHPVYEGGQLGLAAYPSVAFWNPYNVPISSEEIFIEVPIEVGMQSVNAKHYDLYRKWWMYCFDEVLFETRNPGVDPTKPPPQHSSRFQKF